MPTWTTDEFGAPVYLDETGTPVDTSSPGGGMDPYALAGLMSFNPQQTPQPAPAPAPAPAPSAPATPPKGLEAAFPSEGLTPPASLSLGRSARVSERGLNEGLADRLRKGKGVERQIAAVDAEAAQRKAEGLAEIDRTVAAEQAALQDVGKAQGEIALEKSRGAADLSEYVSRLAGAEEAAAAQARAEANQAKADFEAQLSEFRAMRVDPNQVWKGMGTGDRFGTLVSVFVADFLAAGGIKTSVMDTINRSIDRSIDAQRAEIQKQGQVVEGYRNIWEMNRAQSQSDAEARARTRVMMLDSFKAGVEARLGQYESGLANAEANSAAARVDTESIKARNDLHRIIDDSTQSRVQAMVQLEKARLDAAMQARSIASNERIAAAAARAKAAGSTDEKRKLVVRDPQGNVIGLAGSEKVANESQDQLLNVNASVNTLRNAIDLVQRTGRVLDFPTIGKMVQGVDEAALKSYYNTWALTTAKALSGAQYTDRQLDFIKSQVPFQDWSLGLASGDGDQIMSKVAALYGISSIEDLRQGLTARLQPPSELDKELYRGGTSGPVLEGQETYFKAANEGRLGPQADDVDRAQAWIDSPGADEAANRQEVDETHNKAWDEWAASNTELANASFDDYEGYKDQGPGSYKSFGKLTTAWDKIEDIPGYAVGMGRLFTIAETTRNDSEREKALAQLARWAQPSEQLLEGQEIDPDVRARESYAQYLLLKLGSGYGDNGGGQIREVTSDTYRRPALEQ